MQGDSRLRLKRVLEQPGSPTAAQKATNKKQKLHHIEFGSAVKYAESNVFDNKTNQIEWLCDEGFLSGRAAGKGSPRCCLDQRQLCLDRGGSSIVSTYVDHFLNRKGYAALQEF